MSGEWRERPETLTEAMEHALMLTESLQMMQNTPETEDLRREILRLYRFLRRYMDAEALRTGKRKPKEELISVAGLLHGIWQEAQCEAILRGITLREDAGTSAFVVGDTELLRRVLWNLLQNAMTAAENGGEILLQCRIQGESCQITVLDNGKGFGECDPQTLFREASEASGFGVIRRLLDLYRTALSFERQNEYTAVGFVLPRVLELPKLHAPKAEVKCLQGLSDAEIELSALGKVE